jgi:multiple sugar transport system permease protein
MYFRAGYAAAVSTVFFVLLLVLTVAQLRLQRHWVHY